MVSSFPITSALQSWGWGEVKKLSGWRPERVALYQGEELVAAAQLLRRKLAGPFSMLYAPRGPALLDIQYLPRVAEALRASAAGTIYLKLEPELGQDPAAELCFPKLLPSESIQPEYSLWLDLSRGEEALLAAMKPKHRYNTRLALKKGVVPEITQDLEAFWPLFAETNKRAKLLQHSREYYQTVLREMNQPEGAAFVSLARLEDQPLSAGLFVAFGGRLDYLYGGSTRERQEVMAPYQMHFGAIQWGLEHGYKIYDLWGVPREVEGSHAAGIDRFKEGFGGRRVRIPAYDLPLSPLYGPVSKAIRLRKSWLNYRARGTARDVLG